MIGRFRQQDNEQVEQLKGFDDFELRLGDVMRGERATLGKSLLDVQRELKIKATYIAAIENADPSAFETPGFIAGYVRSYARYLNLDPEWAYRAFCAEGNFETAHGMSAAASTKRVEAARKERANNDPFADRKLGFIPKSEGLFSGIEPGAVGSVVVLAGLIGLIGYGGYAVLNEVQKVQFVPVEQIPEVVADLDPLTSAQPSAPDVAGVASVASDGFDRLYRPQALDVPVLVPRDGPIATLDPRAGGALASSTVVDSRVTAQARQAPSPAGETAFGLDATAPFGIAEATPAAADLPGIADAIAPEQDSPSVQVVATANPDVVMFAVRDSWVRVRAADGTVIYEQTMKEGDRFVLPQTEEPATLRTGNSGAIYFAVNGAPYGPVGSNGQVTSNLALSAGNLTESYQVADLERDAALARVVVELRDLPSLAPPVAQD